MVAMATAQTSTVRGLRFTNEMWTRLDEAARANGQSRNAWCEAALRAELERHDRLAAFADAVQEPEA